MSHRKALNHLRKVDPVMARVIKAVGPCRFAARDDHSHFHHIARAIVYQQLSTGAATTIHGRFVALFDSETPAPHEVAAMDDARMRGAGLSRQKASYIKDLAAKVDAGELPLDRVEQMSDAEIIASLTKVKGIGVWSAQMFLMFRLGRPDVLPALDLGIQKGVQRAYGLRKHPTPKRVLEIGKKWTPYSTIASWYLWRSLEL
jgi:DNA-3-methyladenine glycosylase II